MQYLIIHEGKIFYTKFYSHENCYVEGMVVIDLVNHVYTSNGKEWVDIGFDHL